MSDTFTPGFDPATGISTDQNGNTYDNNAKIDQWANQLVQETGIPLEDARSIVHRHTSLVVE